MIETTDNLSGAFDRMNLSAALPPSPFNNNRPLQTPLRAAIGSTPDKPPRTPLTSAGGKKSWSTSKSQFFDDENRSSAFKSSTPFSPYKVSLFKFIIIIIVIIIIIIIITILSSLPCYHYYYHY